jgi:phage terminase large subunit
VSFQQLLADTNPDADSHWLHKRAQDGSTRMLHSLHSDNPRLIDDDGDRTEFGEAYLGRLDRLTGVRRLRLVDGRWVAAEGVIYEEWSPATHLVDRFDVPDDWPRWWAVDFGYRNPFVLQCWAVSPDGQLVLYREIYHSQRLVEDHARRILEVVAPDGEWLEPAPFAVVCDHDAEDRATLERHLGRSTVPAHKAVTEGIQAVQARMRVAGNSKPGLVIMRDSVVDVDPDLVDSGKPTCTADEIPSYVWAPPAPGRAPKEEPVKIDDHGSDALRYIVAEVDLGGRPRVRYL